LQDFHSQQVIRLGVVKAWFPVMAILIPVMGISACQGRATVPTPPISDNATGPTFKHVTTSSKSFSIDCVPTSITVTTSLTAPAGVKRVVLHARVGTDQAYTALDMNAAGDEYQGTIKAVDMPGKGYGVWEFYITAEDLAGNQSQTPLDRSVEMLQCVSN
jgi:hypothetical protein